MEPPCCTCRNLMLAIFVVANVFVISTLMFDFSPILEKYQLYSEETETKQEDWAPVARQRPKAQNEKIDPTAWTRLSREWWENHKLNRTDENWEGRHQLHNKLKTGNLWYDKNVQDYFLGKLEAQQFPSNCTENYWIAYRPMDSGLLSCTHVIGPVYLMALFKGMQGNALTVIPVGYLVPDVPENPTYDGCGERKDKHLGCFFNITKCRVEDDPARYDTLMKASSSSDKTSRGVPWEHFMRERNTPQGGMTVLRNWMWPVEVIEKVEDTKDRSKREFWNEMLKHGSFGIHGMPDEAVEHIWMSQMDFVLYSLMSSWMMKQTSLRVKRISDDIMAKYSSPSGRPLWKPPVMAIHIRQTDKSAEDPYFVKNKKYRSVDDYVTEMDNMETKHGFKWESMFIISDSGSAIQSLAQAVNNVSGLPDSSNGEEGKRFIMYDWTDDKDLIERTGGHNNIPPDMKFAAQEHFLATLYIIDKIADYAIVQYSSNVGRFISELIGARHRLSCADRVGPNAMSMDYYWRHV